MGTSAAMPLFRIEHLSKRFGGSPVVDGLSLQVEAGECLGGIGPNGAGKTTTNRMGLGPVSPDPGLIEAFGLPIAQQVREAKKRMGVLPQFDSLDPDFSCAENLRVCGRCFGLTRETVADRAPRLLEFAALQSKARAKPAKLSGGMRRRLSLARALINGSGPPAHPRRVAGTSATNADGVGCLCDQRVLSRIGADAPPLLPLASDRTATMEPIVAAPVIQSLPRTSLAR